MPDTQSNKPLNDGASHHGLLAALLYAGSAFVAALIFWLVTSFTGSYLAVARFGGAAWVFILFMIVLMPVVIPKMKKRDKTPGQPTMHHDLGEGV